MNISRNAFYRLVKMQNLLNEMRIEKSHLTDAIQEHLEWQINNLQSEIQSLTSSFLKEVDRHQVEAVSNDKSIWAEIEFL